MKNKVVFLLVALGLIISFCNNKPDNNGIKYQKLNKMPVVAQHVTVNGSELISCDITKLKDSINLPLSALAEELKMVKLDNKDEALISGGVTIVTDNYILVRNKKQNPFKLFNKEGKFITAIGAYGQGPNEYLNVYDEYFDEKSGQIFILPWQANKVLRFNLKGEPLKPIPLKYRVPKGKFVVDSKNKTISVMLLPFKGIPSVAWTQDFEGNVINEIPAGHLAVVPDFSNEVGSDKNTKAFDCSLFVFFGNRPDTLYHYNGKNSILEPKFTLDFKNKKRKIHWYQELPNHFLGTLTIEKKLTENTSVTEYPSKYIVNKKTGKGAFYKLYNDYLGGLPMKWASFYNGYYVWNVDPGVLTEALENRLKNTDLNEKTRKKLTDLLNSIDENDNNYVFYSKLKQ